MKKICELIGTGDLFAEIAKIKTFSAFSGDVVLILFPP